MGILVAIKDKSRARTIFDEEGDLYSFVDTDDLEIVDGVVVEVDKKLKEEKGVLENED